MAGIKVWLEADIARVDCRACGRVRTQVVPWARPNARHSRDFEDVVAWLAQRSDMTTVAALMRCSWAAVSAIAGRVVAEHVDDDRLNGLYRIGVDEISYRRGHRRLEGINSRIRLIQRRGYGYRRIDSLATMIYLCLGGVTLELPTR